MLNCAGRKKVDQPEQFFSNHLSASFAVLQLMAVFNNYLIP